jgi:type IV pilus assembly protein PilP
MRSPALRTGRGRLAPFFAVAALAAAPFAILACGGEEISTNPFTPPPRAAPLGSASVAAKTGPEYAESDFVENDRNRDPFRSYASQFGDAQRTKSFKAQRRVILSQYSLDELKLVAIVQGAEYSRAMVTDPRGKGWVLKRGDFVGRAETVHTGGTNGTDYQLNWRVDRVRDGDVVLIREDPAQPNIPPSTRVVPLHPEGDTKNQQKLNDDDQF